MLVGFCVGENSHSFMGEGDYGSTVQDWYPGTIALHRAPDGRGFRLRCFGEFGRRVFSIGSVLSRAARRAPTGAALKLDSDFESGRRPLAIAHQASSRDSQTSVVKLHR